MAKSVVFELVSRIEGYETNFEVVSVHKENNSYVVEVVVKEETSEDNTNS